MAFHVSLQWSTKLCFQGCLSPIPLCPSQPVHHSVIRAILSPHFENFRHINSSLLFLTLFFQPFTAFYLLDCMSPLANQSLLNHQQPSLTPRKKLASSSHSLLVIFCLMTPRKVEFQILVFSLYF
jgi:hypothetical protein